MRRANRWLAKTSWWRFTSIYFVLMTVILSLAAYVTAWISGDTDEDVGFTTNGHFALPYIAMSAAIVTTAVVVVRAWSHRRSRKTSSRPRDTVPGNDQTL